MAGAERFVVLGLAPVRTEWFRNVGRWANEAAIPVEFVKCVSVGEVRSRLDSGRPFSALLVDALTPGLDRELLDGATVAGCAPVIVDGGLSDRDWRSLGAVAVLPDRFDSRDLLDLLRQASAPIGDGVSQPAVSPPTTAAALRATTITVTGTGGTGASTTAMALAQGLSTRPEYRRLLLADMALRASQALMHDAGDVVPALSELIEAHRFGTPSDRDIASTIFSLPELGYHLLLGLRHQRDWLTVSGRALDATWSSLDRCYATVIADITADFDGSDETGANDLEDRNRLARVAARRADLVLVVGAPGTWGVHRLVTTVLSLLELGVDVSRILPVVNRSPRHPRSRAEITAALGQTLGSRHPDAQLLPSPLFLPDRRQLDLVIADRGRVPGALTEAVAEAVVALLRLRPSRARPPRETEALVPIEPGSLGVWSSDD